MNADDFHIGPLTFKHVEVKIMKDGPFKQAAMDRADERKRLIDTVNSAKTKWDGVKAATKALGSAVYAHCSFCNYYEECEDCPFGTPEKGLGKGCDDYELITKLMGQISEATNRVLDVINDVDTDEPCMHLTEMEITCADDDRRYYKCLDCGRHRTESFSPIIGKRSKIT